MLQVIEAQGLYHKLKLSQKRKKRQPMFKWAIRCKLSSHICSLSKLLVKVIESCILIPWKRCVTTSSLRIAWIMPNSFPSILQQTYHMNVSDPDIWESVGTGNFSVKKTELVFCMLGTDQTLQQVNGTLKVTGSFKGITQKSNALAKYFLAPE